VKSKQGNIGFLTSIVAAMLLGMVLSSMGQQVTKAGCDWQLVNETLSDLGPDIDGPLDDEHQRGTAFATGHPDSCFASGFAWDKTVPGDVTMHATRVGLRRRTWQNMASQKGRATVLSGVCRIDGEAHLIRAECAAAAVGFTEFSSTLTETVVAQLKNSNGQTQAQKIGDIKAEYEAWGVKFSGSFDINLTTGTGRYPDSDAKTVAPKSECTNLFSAQHRTGSDLKCFADGGFLSHPIIGAKCEAKLNGTVKSLTKLDCCPGS